MLTTSDVVLADNTDAILAKVLAILREKYPANQVEPDSQVSEHSLADSQVVLDIIMQVETEFGAEFNPEAFDVQTPLTPRMLSRAFRVS